MSTETGVPSLRSRSLSNLDYVAIVLVTITGVIHLLEGVEDWGEGFIGLLFILAGLGYFGAIALLFVGVDKRALYLAGILYTGIQVVAYFLLRWPDIYEPIGLLDKVVQVVLIVVLAVSYFKSR